MMLKIPIFRYVMPNGLVDVTDILGEHAAFIFKMAGRQHIPLIDQ
jgi:hypothetical protein